MNVSKQVNMFTETLVAENAEDIKASSVFDMDFDLRKLSVSPIPYGVSRLGDDESSMKMTISDVTSVNLLSALDPISFDESLELGDSVIKDTIKPDNFDSFEADLHKKDTSAIDVYDSVLAELSSHSHLNDDTEVLVGENHEENLPLKVYTYSQRRSARNNKLNQNNIESQNPSRNCQRIAPKKSVLKFNTLQITRRKRSLLSKRARSSVWGVLGNILPECSGLDLNKCNDKKARRSRVVKGNMKTSKDQKERKSKAKNGIPSGRISLRIKIGNQRCELLTVTQSFNASQKSIGEVMTGHVVLQAESNLDKKISSDASVLSTHLDLTGIPERISSNNSSDSHFINPEEGDNLRAFAENRCSDSGTSPDSEVVNSVPDGPLFEKDMQNMHGSPITKDSPSGGVSSSILPGTISKKGKKKDRHYQAGECSVEWSQIDAEVTDNDQDGAAPELGLGMGDISFDGTITKTAKQYLKTYCSMSVSHGPSRCSRMDVENPSAISKVLDDTEKNPSSRLVWAVESLDSQACGSFPCMSGENFPKCSKASGGSKSRSAVSLQNKKDASKKKEHRNSLRPKHQVDLKVDVTSPLCGVERHVAAGNQMSSDLGGSRVQSKGSCGSMDKYQILTSGELEQNVTPRNAWVLCDECQKWRRIPSLLADQIEETNCGWTCEQNMDKDFADCSVPQEMTNSEINEELEILEASCEEGACNTFPRSNQNLSNGLFSQRSSWSLIKSNLFLHRRRKTQTIDEVMVCHCKPPSDGRMGCGAKCLNRMLNIECVQGTCPCGELCSNQEFQRCKYAQLMWFKCGKKGCGLQALENISQGQFLIEYVGEVLDMHVYEARQREYALKGHRHFYVMTLNGSEIIDACAKGNLGRFINHSCDPNCRTEKWMVNGEVCVGLFALRDIKKGEEVTFDYNYVRVFGAAAKKCVCGSPNCRGYIGGDPTNAEAIVQGDSDDEYYEPVMTCEDNEMNEDWSNIMNSLNNGEAECTNKASEKGDETKELVGHMEGTDETHNEETLSQRVDVANSGLPDGCTNAAIASQIVNSLVRDKFVVGKDCPGQLEMDKENGDSLNRFPSAASKVESEELLDPLHSSSESKNISPQSNEYKWKTKYTILGGNHELTKSSSAAKPCRSSIKKGKPKSHVDKGSSLVEKLNVAPSKPKRSPTLSLNNNFEAVEEKLNGLLDPQGGISNRKDASRGYLKLLFLTAASGNSGHGEAIQSNRDLSMILDALLKTKSRRVLLDIINKNGLQMLHNIMKRYRKEFIKTPILRKLLKVLEYLAIREILNLEHISGGPPCPGVESFKDSVLTLTEHTDKQVHQIARNFRDRWIPRSLRKNCFMERDDAPNEIYQRSCGRLLVSLDHTNDRGGKPSEAIDSSDMHLVATSGTVENKTVDNSASVSCSGANGTKPRKRKSRWDTPAEDFPYSKPRTDLAGDSMSNIHEDFPPGFSSLCIRRLVPSDASSSPNTQRRREAHIKHPSNIALGTSQHRFIARIPVSYGIPSSVIQQFGVIQPETLEAWTVAPGVPFHAFPPLPPMFHDKIDLQVSAAKCVPLSETVEKAEQVSDICVDHHAGQKHSRTWNSDLPEMNVPVANDESDSHQVGLSCSLGRKYFRQQKLNHSKLAPPWVQMRSGWGNAGNDNSRNGAPGAVLGDGENEFRIHTTQRRSTVEENSRH